MSAILVAGIGNIFDGDDGFGVAVAQRLLRRPPWPGVEIVDFGIRGVDLTYALLDNYRAAVLIDAAQRGELPGTISVVTPELPAGEPEHLEDQLLSPHDLDPAKVLRFVAALGGGCRRIVLVVCEPASLGGEDGKIGLSAVVEAALEAAIAAVDLVVRELQEEVVR